MTITKELVRQAIDAEVVFPDGHTIFFPEHYAAFFDVKEWGIIHTYKSDGTGKGSIFDHDGKMLASLEGVYNLTFLQVLARKCGIDYQPYSMGRGSEAQEWYRELRKWSEYEPAGA